MEGGVWRRPFLIRVILAIALAFDLLQLNGAVTMASSSLTLLPLVIGHRGAPGYRVENTLPSYEEAADLGADYVEADLMTTKDHVLIATHSVDLSEITDVAEKQEFALRRTTKIISGYNITGWFPEDFTLAEIKTLRTRERFPFRGQMWNGLYQIPTLDEMIRVVKAKEVEKNRQIGIYLETKHPTHFQQQGLPLEEPLVETLNRHGYHHQNRSSLIFLESFETTNLRKLKEMIPVRLIQLIDELEYIQYDTGRLYSELVTKESLKEISSYAAGIGPSKFLIKPHPKHDNRRIVGKLTDRSESGPTTSLIQDAHEANLLVHVFTFRSDPFFLENRYSTDEEEYMEFLNLGVDGMFSDFPDRAKAIRDKLYWGEETQPSTSDCNGNQLSAQQGLSGTGKAAAVVFLLLSVAVVLGAFGFALYLVWRKRSMGTGSTKYVQMASLS